MRNLFKYSPIKLRSTKDKSICPLGPTGLFAKRTKFVFSGNDFYVNLPPHFTTYPIDNTIYKPNHDRISNYSPKLKSNEIKGNIPISYWFYGRKAWGFNGPWLLGEMATLTLYVSANKFAETKPGISLFHPRELEYAATNLMTSRYGQDVDLKGNSPYKAPSNWTPKITNSFAVPSVRFSVTPMKHTATAQLSHYALFPVSDEVWVLFYFAFGGTGAVGMVENRSENSPQRDMWRLVDEVIASMSLELKGESLKQYQAVSESCDDMSVCKDFAPLKWPATMESLLQEGEASQNNLIGP